MDWPAAQRFVADLESGARRDLLRVLTTSSEVRADLIGQLYRRAGGQDMAELLTLLEEREWARQAMIEELRAGSRA